MSEEETEVQIVEETEEETAGNARRLAEAIGRLLLAAEITPHARTRKTAVIATGTTMTAAALEALVTETAIVT